MKNGEKTTVNEKIVPENESPKTVTIVTAKEESRIYIGPSFKGVITGTVYGGNLPPALQEALYKVPAIGELVVPLSKLVEKNKELLDKDSALNRFYRLAATYGKGE
ncbi:MAG: hypothetical protein LBN31_08080 [Hungatella sp.]|jgi:hypothetical protein|nr:hypothetical protein [Hungatella sp.]